MDFKIDRIIQIKRNADVPIKEIGNRDVVVRPVSPSNVNDAEGFCSESQIKSFEAFLEKGYKGYFAYVDNVCVSRIWVFTDSDRAYLNDRVVYKLRPNELYQGWAETDPNYRKRGIFLSLQNYAFKDNQDYDILATIDYDNKASLNANIKCGYHIYRKYFMITIGRLKVSIIHSYEGFFRLKIKLGSYV